MAEMLVSRMLLYLSSQVHVQWCHVGGLILATVGLFIWRKLAHTATQDIPSPTQFPPLFFPGEPFVIKYLPAHTRGMPRNEKKIDTVIFCVICLVLLIMIFSHNEGKKQLGDKETAVRKKVEA